ncbi:MAG: hypothetical protein IT232_00395 [Flavobacteriales bacterium]|nr:hypothetical protein [Flavobacteriales bacterium]
MKKNIIDSTKIIILSTIVILGASYIYAWTGPSNTAPNSNTPAPLNVGLGNQIKSGTLALTGLLSDGVTAAATGLFVGNGNVLADDFCIKNLNGSSTGKCLSTAGSGNGTASWTAIDLNDKSSFDPSCHYFASIGGTPHVDFSFINQNVITEYTANGAYSINATNKKVEANNGYVVSALYKSCAGSGGAQVNKLETQIYSCPNQYRVCGNGVGESGLPPCVGQLSTLSSCSYFSSCINNTASPRSCTPIGFLVQ